MNPEQELGVQVSLVLPVDQHHRLTYVAEVVIVEDNLACLSDRIAFAGLNQHEGSQDDLEVSVLVLEGE